MSEKITLICVKREGSTKRFVVEPMTADQKAAASAKFGSNRVGKMTGASDSPEFIYSQNKREAELVEAFISSWGVPAAAPAQSSSSVGQRYIERLVIAQRDGLNHGKPWVCTGMQADRDSLPPEFEGELICYVYPA